MVLCALWSRGGCEEDVAVYLVEVGLVKMLAVECGGLLGLRHSQGGAAVLRCGRGDEFAPLGSVRVVVRGWRARRIEVCVVESGSDKGRGRARSRGGNKFCVRAVASAYPPIAQTEKTFRLPIDYYQVCFRARLFSELVSERGHELGGSVA